MSEEEGEFKKRIKQEFKKAYDSCYSSLAPKNQAEVAGLIDVGLKPNILKILDEAKKECPFTQETFDMDFAKNDLYWKDEVKKWFLKWFGEKE
jgi:hypothetical protein